METVAWVLCGFDVYHMLQMQLFCLKDAAVTFW
jgi:hypothetical protein